MSTRHDAIPRNLLGARTGIEVSKVGLGLWAVPGSDWGPGDLEQSRHAIEASLEAGVNFFDTADVYGDGTSETLLGRSMSGRRDRFVVATKLGWTGFDADRGRSRYDTTDKVVEDVLGSLRRLDTDYVDVIQCHIPFVEPNTDVIIESFRRLKDDGTVRAWGVSTGDLAVLQHFNSDGDCDVLQVDYSILNRAAETELLPYCSGHGIGVVARGPLAMGLLTGKLSATQMFPEEDFRGAWIEDQGQHAQFRRDLEVVDRLRQELPDGQPMSAFAIRFASSHPAVSTAIPGARNREQAVSNSAAALLPALGEAEQAAVDRIVPPGGGRKIWPA
jgi:aryl-alcohol dehydrogenase-like predicted oxidoreductase